MSHRYGPWLLLATLGVLVAITIPELGADPWPFMPAAVHPRGILGPLVRVADREWDLGILRSTAVLAGLLVALAAAATWRIRSWPRWFAIALPVVVCGMLLVPATLLQVGLRDATEPWYFTNDSTYQIEIAGDLVRHGHTPYGHDYGNSGLERFYPAANDQEAAFDRAARHHFAYFPGTALTAAAWRVLPRPWDDYRIFVLLATLALLPAALVFPGALYVRLAVGSGLAANPILLKGAWFGTADAPAILALVLAFGLLARGRLVWAAASLGAALALKQFSLVAVPFFAVMLLTKHTSRATLYRAGAAFGGVFLATVIPFLVADPGALWRRHRLLRRGHVPHRRLRPRCPAPQPRGDRRPVRQLPVRLARALPLAPADRVAALGATPRRDPLGRRYRFFRFDVRPALFEPCVPELVPRLAFDRHRARALARFR